MPKKQTLATAKIKELYVASPEGGTIYVEPVSGVQIPYKGDFVPDLPFWRRRIDANDVVELEAELEAEPEAEPAAEPEAEPVAEPEAEPEAEPKLASKDVAETKKTAKKPVAKKKKPTKKKAASKK
jgi:hypothetical protein